ncbi:uncharacterized protein MKK02DRAFT_40672 [Dioszegia hungarica]|uniref:Uncharacterized protein n=1 Tax=Dioszegia hungarica TaxID=4972 RepID=A0AA38LSB2_9TREE|nr:uncharacterized protein MKK02DRAFT_40672 [Dioszegia hungarica]KAI9632369.1 hypothetical protein MKK02DRAFT_40672 [Dioszegia hungarica]
MPAPWTSTTFSSILRQAIAVAKNVPLASRAGAALTGRRARQALQVFQEALPTLTESAGHLNGRPLAYATEPIRLGTRSHRPMSAHARMHAAGRNFRSGSGGSRSWKAGPSMARSNVGLGSARTFASGPTSSAVSNVPVVLRAFVSLLDDEEFNHKLPRATRYTPYKPRKSTRQARRRHTRRAASIACSVDSRLSISELSHFFPYISTSTATPSLPPTVDTLVTPGTTAILSLPLSPSLSALLSSTTQVPYAAAEVGVSVLSSLSMGVLGLQEAFSLHYWHRIGPLLARLDDLGFLGGESGRGVRHEMIVDSTGRPDILRLTFSDRSEADVMQLLDGWLVEEGGRTWWGLREISEVGGETEMGAMKLSNGERKEMMEDWDESGNGAVPQVIFDADAPAEGSTVDLIFPSLETGLPVEMDQAYWSPLSPSSGSPHSLHSPISDYELESDFSMGSGSGSPISPNSPVGSLSTSILSQLSSLPSEDSRRWSVHPSEDDLEVESAVSEMWSGAGSEVWDEEDMVEVQLSWAGVGQGMGSRMGLADSW